MALKRAKPIKKQQKKTSIFFMCFYWAGNFFINRKGLFYAKFFEFEVKS
jgi:hypothetical protein